ncbi:MAG: TetR/AcrR family transcriptional regulator [Nocardioidaceae bacterium]|nr:TetR/AcrR family transcriptional regulator [Nocardioidaceae bacterium]
MPKITAERRAARRDHIVAAGWRCVAREGFHKTTMADVINEAGMSAGAVYGYFRSKNEIIKAISGLAIGQVADLLQDMGSATQPVSLADALQTVLTHIATMADHEDGDLTRVGVQAWAESLRDPDIHAIVSERMGQLRAGFEVVARHAQKDGLLSSDADPAEVAQVMLGLVPGFALQRLLLGDVTPQSYVAGFRALTA